jgi:transposase
MQRPDLSQLSEAEKDVLILELFEIIERLEARIVELEGQLGKDSHNSSKPPSSDWVKKPAANNKSLRAKGQRKVGGQKGHKGHTLKFSAKPDKIEIQKAGHCEHCFHSFSEEDVIGFQARQVVDLPELKMQTTEYRALQSHCPCCQHTTQAQFPIGVDHRVQYGKGIKALSVYLKNYQLIPYERQSELFADVFEHTPSLALLVEAQQQCHQNLKSLEQMIKSALLQAPVVCFDESGLRVEGSGHWIHSASTADLTLYFIHKKRGTEAMREADVLPHYAGIAVHDGYHSYPTFKNCEHALCNAHHLRELTLMFEHYGQEWAMFMMVLLKDTWRIVKRHKALGLNTLSQSLKDSINACYDYILAEAFKEIAQLPIPPPNKRGKPKQHPAKNLYDRLYKRKVEVLRFMCDFRVPFDNNQAERDIRMIKTQQKISGTFRTLQGAKVFCRIRSYLSTLKKQGQNLLFGIQAAIENLFAQHLVSSSE